MPPPTQRVSVIVPCRNEAGHVDAFLGSLFAQRLPEGVALEVVIADGDSDDGTPARLQAWAARDPRLKIVPNPRRATAVALNLALQACSGDTVVRMDVHTTYADDYIAQCLQALQDTGATVVGGPWCAAPGTGRAGAIAAAFGSRFGSGGAASRRVDYSGPVDTVYLGTWRRSELLRLGGFDESLLRTEDDELNLRILRSGGKVWQSARIRCWYRPRSSFSALAAQLYQYGYWKVPLIRKHRLPASPRHLLPVAFLAALVGLGALGFVWPPAWLALALLAGSYTAAALGAAAAIERPWHAPLRWASIAWAFACMHFAYGAGFARALFDAAFSRGQAGESATRLTR
jgi:succinoglycan biosynthesis protein ExoA